MPHLAVAVSLLLLLSSILLICIASQINVAIAKKCTDMSTNDDGSSSCNTQDSNSFTHSRSGNDGNGEVISLKHTKKYFNHESHDGDSENDTPFALPFP
jgi:hypothetical protein